MSLIKKTKCKRTANVVLIDNIDCLEDPLADVDLLVDLAVLEQLVPEVGPPQRHPALRAGTGT